MTNTTHGSYWGGTVLPYWVFLVLTVLPTGFFGLDHLLFKSPSTALAKGFFNIFTLGLWYFYDILQVFTDKHYVKHFGLSIPIVGARGLAFQYFRGIVGDEKEELGPSKGGYSQVIYFILYFFTLLVPFGISSFVAGDTSGGTYKVLFSIIPLLGLLLIPLFWIESVVELYTLLTNPAAIFEKGVPRMFPIDYVASKNGFSPNIMEPKSLEAMKKIPDTNLYTAFIKPIMKLLGIKDPMEILDTAKCQVIPPIEKTAKAAIAAGEGIQELASKGPAIASAVANKVTAFTDPEELRKAALKAQTGGSNGQSLFDGIVVGGLALLILGGLGATVLRKTLTVENVTNDSPPNPGTI